MFYFTEVLFECEVNWGIEHLFIKSYVISIHVSFIYRSALYHGFHCAINKITIMFGLKPSITLNSISTSLCDMHFYFSHLSSIVLFSR